jgi:2-desacetyl-2-hydroxyethyl bacteriochlorophyllide A dehydrogenase
MKAICQDRYGSPDVLELREIEKPVIDADGVLVKVAASSVNALDWHFMRGTPLPARAFMGLRRPKPYIRGVDLAGRVEAVGANVRNLKPGDEVFGGADGAFAEYVIGLERYFALRPANLTMEQAAAMPIAATTALQALRDIAQVKPGQRVLINGAGGGVGSFAVQIARSFGADVTAVTSTANLDLVRSLGAEKVIDYTAEDFTRGGERYDAICTIGGNRPLSSFSRALTPQGLLVIIGADNPLTAVFFSRFHRRMRFFAAKRTHADLLVLKELAEAGKVTPVIDSTYPLTETAAAVRHMETGHARGKVVITVP